MNLRSLEKIVEYSTIHASNPSMQVGFVTSKLLSTQQFAKSTIGRWALKHHDVCKCGGHQQFQQIDSP